MSVGYAPTDRRVNEAAAERASATYGGNRDVRTISLGW
jgi:hypothetical protein